MDRDIENLCQDGATAVEDYISQGPRSERRAAALQARKIRRLSRAMEAAEAKASAVLAAATLEEERVAVAVAVYDRRDRIAKAMAQRLSHLEYIKAKYAMSLEQWTTMLIRQSGRCAICEDELRGRGEPFVDHDHATGAVRGLLCSGCNAGLGQFGDNVSNLARAIAYLVEAGL